MRKFGAVAVLLACVVLVGCGQPTPLSHALAAFRAGDIADFHKARDEAKAETAKAIQPGGDLCRLSAGDIARYNAVEMIAQLDREELFQKPPEDRLIVALAVAGKHAHIWAGSFLAAAPVASVGTGASDTCGDKIMAAMLNGTDYMKTDDDARMAVLQGWIEALKRKHGDAFDSEMAAAAGRLRFNGYPAAWPPEVDFGTYATMPGFGSVRDRLK
jgi:hypothetical protein